VAGGDGGGWGESTVGDVRGCGGGGGCVAGVGEGGDGVEEIECGGEGGEVP